MPNSPLSPLDAFLSEQKGLPEFNFDRVERVERRPSSSGVTVPADLMPMFENAARRHGVPVNVLLALGEQESGFNPRAVGQQTKWGTAKGIMQYLDSTAAGLGINPYDPEQAIDGAARQLRERLDKGYSMEDAVMEHFAGPDRAQWGPKTAQYGIDVMQKAQRYVDGYQAGEATPGDIQPAPSPLTIENQNSRNAEIARGILDEMNREEPGRYSIPTAEQLAAVQDPAPVIPTADPFGNGAMPEQKDGFLSATGKAVGNIPENFQNAGGGLIRYLGEDMSATKERSLQRVADNLGITLDDAKLVYWAEQNGLIEDELKAGNTQDMVAALRQRHVGDPETNAAVQRAFTDGGIFSPEALAEAGREVSQDAKDSMAEINPDGPLAKYGSMIIGSTAEMVPALLAGMVTRNPNVTLGMIGTQVYGQSYDRAREAGENALEPQDAARYALAQAAAEAIPSALPVSVILKPGGNLFTGLLKAGAAESLQEGVTSILQSGIDKGTITPDMTWGEAAAQLRDSMIVGAGAGVAMKGGVDATNAGAKAAGKLIYEARGGDVGQLGRMLSQDVDNADLSQMREQVASSGPLGRALSQSIPVELPTNPVVREPEERQEPVADAVSEPVAEPVSKPVGETIPQPEQSAEAPQEQAKSGQRVTLEAEGIDPITGEILEQTEEGVMIRGDDGSAYQVPADDIRSGAVTIKRETAEAVETPREQPQEPKSYDQMSEAELRERLKYLGQQAKTSGWDKRLTTERRKVEDAIEALKVSNAETENVPNEQPATVEAVEAAQPDQSPPVQLDEVDTAAPAADTAPAVAGRGNDVLPVSDAANEQPALKWFGTQEKADAYIAKKNLGETHSVVQEGRRFEIRPIEQPPKPEEPKVKGHVNRAKKLIGGDVGDTITMSGDVGYATANTAYKVESIDKKGTVYVTNLETGSGTTLSRADLERAKNGGVTFTKGVAETGTPKQQGQQPYSRKLVRTYLTKGGEVGAEVRETRAKDGRLSYSYAGKWGGGSVDAEAMRRIEGEWRASKRGFTVQDSQAKSESEQDRKAVEAETKGTDLGDGWAEFTPDSGTLRIPRADMPQIKAEHRGAMVNFLEARGVTHSEAETVPADSLKPTQAEFSRDKVAKAKGFEGGDRSILVSSDNHVLDGHHQWLAKREAGEDVKVIRLDAPIRQLLSEVAEFPSATTDEGLAQSEGKPTVSENKVFTEDAAEKARQLLRSKLGQLNTGIDPEIMQAGITLAGYHIEKGARTFAAYAKAMTADLGGMVKPYLKSWYMGVKYDPRAAGFDGMSSAAEVEAFNLDEAAEPAGSLVDELYSRLARGEMPKDNNGLRKLVADLDGKPADNARLKQAQEDLEAAMARYARDVVAKGQGDQATYAELVELYNNQPNLNIRTSTSVGNQAYSTPAPLAYLAARLAGIDSKAKVYEPTAGNGMLLITADPKNATANELEAQRYQNLVDQGFDATQGDAMDVIESGIVNEKSQDAVITNPPFGSVKDDAGNATKVSVDGYKIGKIDHLIAAEALRAMKDGGKATLIIGADKKAGGLSTDDRIFFNWLYGRYNVTGHFELDGKLYSRQGAGWPVRVITINGRKQSDSVSPVAGTIQRVNSWDEVYDQYEQVLGAQERAAGADGAAGREVDRATDDAGAAPRADARQADKPVREVKERGAQAAGNVPGADARTAADQGDRAAKQLAERGTEQRVDGEPPQPDRLDAGAQGAASPASASQRGAARSDAGKPAGNALTDAENAFQTKYVPRSSRKDDGVLVPVNMAQPMQDALSSLEDAVGDIDQFVTKELGYGSVKETHDALMGLQVDSVASAIFQIKERQKGIIIADQTGIGKGRQAASMIRWAQKNGRIPVFVTVKPALFTDMYNDLADIGSRDIEPLIMNADEWISSPTGEKLFANKKSTHRKTLEAIAATGELPEGSNALFLTYSQINTDNLQRKALSALANRAVFVLDESHNAGGDSSTGNFMRETLENVEGVTYLSATYAKRPDNMPLYFKTDIGSAISDSDGLMDAMARGGLPLQTVVSSNLVKAGQMFRRERSYDGVSVVTRVDSENREAHEALSDSVTSALRAIVDADSYFHDGYVDRLKKEAEARGEAVQDIAGNQASESVNHTQFSSVVHNFVRQMLLGLQADTAAQQAIDALKRGEKPVIALENTMGSFLTEYAANNNLKPGDALGDFDYRTVLTRALDRTRYVVRVLPNGEKEKQYIPMSKLDEATRQRYQEAQKLIDQLDMDIPVQPLDWIRHRIQQAGYSVAEITGRSLAVDYSGKRPVLAQIPSEEQNDKVATTRRFNSGELDAVILNVAGSTGISLHASEKFKDQRKRHMVIAQAAQDINIFMQMLGRIHRTGQVELPAYTILNADLPAQKRPTAILNKKMKSLNANTSSNTESATSIDAADMLNKYGDQVIANYLDDNPDMAEALGLDGATDSNGNPQEDIARKATGRMALMPVKVQKEFYAEVEEQYTALMNYLNETGQNDLEPRTYDFAAELQADQVLVEETDPNSPFGGEAVYGEYKIKAQGKPMTPDEAQAEILKNLDGKTSVDHVKAMGQSAIRAYWENYNRLVDLERIEGEKVDVDAKTEAMSIGDDSSRTGYNFMREHRIGSTWRVEVNGDIYNGVVTNLRNTHKSNGNPFSLSKIQVTLAVNGPLRSITVPASQWSKIEVAPLSGIGVSQLLGSPVEGSETAKIVTGNLLAAYGELTGSGGTIISFTKSDGSIEQGILLPKKFSLKLNTRGDQQMRTPEDVIKVVTEATDRDFKRYGVSSRDGAVRVTSSTGGVRITVPKSKRRGGKYFLDKRLTALTGDFISDGEGMTVIVPAGKANDALSYLMTKAPLYASSSFVDEARSILGMPPREKLKSSDRASVAATVGTFESAADVERHLRASDIGEQAASLIESGKLVIHKGKIPGAPATVSGLYRDGVMHLSAERLRPSTAVPVLLHEMFHAGARPLVGDKAWVGLMRRLHALRMQAKASGGKAKEIHQAANRRIEAAEAAGVKMTEAVRDEEFGAYMVENYERMPAAFKKWIDDAIGAIKAFMLRRFNLQLGEVTPAQLSALAKAALRSEVRTDAAGVMASQPARQVDTPEFKRWFGDSKVVDADGKPLVVYHGTDSEFSIFEPSERGLLGPGIYLTTERSTAEQYNGPFGDGPIIEAYAKLENPYRFKVNPDAEDQIDFDSQASSALIDLLGEDGARDFIQNADDQARFGDEFKRLLTGKGYDGVIADYGDGLLDVVAFNPEQVKSATENNGNFDPANPDIRASVDAPTDKQVDGWFSRKLTDAMAGPKSGGQYSLLALAPMDRMIDEMAGNNMAAREYLNLKRDMDAYRTKKHTQFDETAQKWLKMNAFNREAGREMAGIMHDATIAQVDPAEEFTTTLTKHEQEILNRYGPDHSGYEAAAEKEAADAQAQLAHAQLKERFNKLPQKFQDLYREVRDTYRQMTEELDKILADNLAAAIDIHGRKAERELEKALEDIRDEGLTGKARADAEEAARKKHKTAMTKLQWNKRARMTQLRQQFESNRLNGPYFPLARFGGYFVTVRDQDGKVISFSRFESRKDQQRFAKQAAQLGEVQTGLLAEEGALKGAVDARFISDVEDILGGAGVDDSVKDQVWQRYLESMPDLSMRKRFIHRKNREGFTQDALRAFASSMFHNAHQMGRLKYGAQMQETIEQAQEYARKTDTPERDTAIVNEIARRHEYVMNPKGAAWAQHLTSAAFIYQLSMSPAAALVNLSQTVILGVPIIGAKHGVAKTSQELMRATKDFTAGRGRADRSKALTAPERDAMRAAYESGLVESTNSHNLAGVGETGVQYSAVRNKIMGVVAWMFHQAERFNREVTFLTAYRLGKSGGMTHEQAINDAINLTYKVHFDYGNTNRPRAMHGDTAKVALVFRNYQINMLYRLFRDMHQSVNGGTKAERKEALRQLGGITGMMALHAGVRGTWGYGIAMVLASMFFGDDAEEQLKKGTVELLGPTAAGMVLNGIPGHALDLALSERIGMPDLWFRSPNRQLEGQDEFNYWQSQLLGFMPVIASNVFRGIDLIADGKTYRGVETMAPKFVKDLMRAYRYGSEGVTNIRGDALVESLTPGELFAQTVGFTPAVVSEQYDRNNALINAERRIFDEKSGLMDRYAMAYKQGDAEEMRAIRAEMQEFNKKNPEVRITPETIMRSLRARQNYSGRTEGGVTLNPKLNQRLRDSIGEPIYR